MRRLWWAKVTVAQYDADGNLQEVVGVVTGTGTYDGNQVVFVGDKDYLLSEILAVGTLPKPETDPGEGETRGTGLRRRRTGTDAAPEV
ncbi:MAG: hypothetical protein V8R75_14140 [Oscillospiraceae bacterium]